MKRLIHLWVVATFASLLMLVSCQPNSKEAAASGQNELTHSQLLSMRKYGNGTMVEIANPWDSTKLMASYLLVPTDETIPQDIQIYSGATLSSEGSYKAINKAIEYYNVTLKGGN